MGSLFWKRSELLFLILYAVAFYAIIIQRSLYLSHDHSRELYGLRQGWMFNRLNDLSDAQWRNFHGNFPILTFVLGLFTFGAYTLRSQFYLKGTKMSVVWFLISLAYILYLHGACVVFVLSIASVNYFLAKILAKSKSYLYVLWIFNISFLLMNRIYEGYSFSLFGNRWAFLDNYRGSFRWQICFNLVVLRMISFGCDYYWSIKETQFDQKEISLEIHIPVETETIHFMGIYSTLFGSFKLRAVGFLASCQLFDIKSAEPWDSMGTELLKSGCSIQKSSYPLVE